MKELPTPDDFFGQATNTGNHGSLPSADEFFGSSGSGIISSGEPVNPATGKFLENHPVGRIMNAFGTGFMEGGEGGQLGIEQGGDIEKSLMKAGIFNNYATGERSITKSINEAFIRPAASVIDNEWRGAKAFMGAVGGGINQTAEEIDNALDTAAARHGFKSEFAPGTRPLLSELAEYFTTTPAALDLHVPPEINRARSVGAIGEAESSYFGLTDPTPEQSVARQHAVSSLEGPESPQTPVPDIHALAREANPAVMGDYDTLNKLKDSYVSWLGKADEENVKQISQPFDERIEDLNNRIEDANARKTKIYQAQLDEVQDQKQNALDKRSDTEEMRFVRGALQHADYQLRDIAPDVSDAYRKAQEQLPAQEPEAVASGKQENTAGTASEQAENASAGEPVSQPVTTETKPAVQAIMDDVTNKLVKAGRPQEEADAAAQLISSHYQSVSDLGWAKGTPEEIYNRDAPNIKKGKETSVTQGKLHVPFNGKNIITLFGKADASTFIHETGHHFLEEMMKYAKAEAAPETVLKDSQTVRDWLGVKEGESISRKQHERFARGFERYMMEGRAPSQQLANVFNKFKQWLTNIYQSVQKLRSPITDDIRDVFDRLLTANPERPIIAPDMIEPETASSTTEGAGSLPTPPVTEPNVPSEAAPVQAAAPNAPANANEPRPVTAQLTRTPEEIKEADAAKQTRENILQPEGTFIKQNGDLNKDALNYALYNNTPGWLQNYFNEYNNKYHSTYGNQTSTVETLESMEKLAKATGWTPTEIRAMEIGQKDKRLQQLASANLFKQMVDEVKQKAADAASSNDPKKIADFFESTQEHSLLMQAFRDQKAYAAEASRNLGIRRAIKSITNDAEQFVDLFQKLTDKAPKDIAKQAEYLNKLALPGSAEKFLKDGAQTKWEKFRSQMLEYYINSLISGPITHLRYSVGNALNALWTPLVEIPAAAGIGRLREVIAGKETPDRVYLGEAGAQLQALFKGSQEGLKAAATAFKTGNSPYLPGEENLASFTPKTQAIPGTFGRVINIPSKSVSAIHSFFKAVRYEQNIQGLAYRNAMKEGLEEGTEAFTNRIADLTTSPSEEMMESATANSLKELYMAPTEYGTAMGHLVQATNKNLALKIIVPFMKIGTQITREAFVERTPLGLLSPEIRETLATQGAMRDMQLAKMSMGTALMGSLSLMTMEGLATGDGPTDPNKRAIWMLNHKPNSIQIGNITIPYKGLGHLGMLMRFSANMTETAQSWNEEEGGKLAVSFLEGITRSVFDENFMRGIKDLSDAMYHPEEYGSRYIRDFATNWLPFSVGAGQIAHAVDPYQREVHDILDSATNRLPLLSETLQPKRDKFGEPIGADTLDRYKDDAVVQRMESLNMGMGRLEKKIRGVQLTPEQYDDYAKMAGRMAKARLDNFVSISGSDTLPQFSQLKIMNNIIDTSREGARQIMLMNYPNIMQQATDKKISALSK